MDDKDPMKPSIFHKGLVLIAVVTAVFSGWAAYSGEGGVEQTIRNATQPLSDAKQLPPVQPLTESVVLANSPYQGGRFWVETRKDDMARFKCSQCHNDENVTEANAAKIAHGDIVLVHGSEEKQLSCYTCHNRKERDYLTSEVEEKLDMDHSYELCGQCHFRQKKDWVGGAHGKRVTYWAGERVVKSCASCHNPHAPRFQKQWPVTYSPPMKK